VKRRAGETWLIKAGECSLASSWSEVSHKEAHKTQKPALHFVPLWLMENKRARTLPSPLWKDRSGRLPETALSITSSRWILRCPSKTQNLFWALSRPAYTNVLFERPYADTCLLEAVWVRGDSIKPCTTWATCDKGFGLRKKASAPARRASASASGDP